MVVFISVIQKPPAPLGKLNLFQVCVDLKYFLFGGEGREGGNKLSIAQLTPARAGKIFLVFRKCSLLVEQMSGRSRGMSIMIMWPLRLLSSPAPSRNLYLSLHCSHGIFVVAQTYCCSCNEFYYALLKRAYCQWKKSLYDEFTFHPHIFHAL